VEAKKLTRRQFLQGAILASAAACLAACQPAPQATTAAAEPTAAPAEPTAAPVATEVWGRAKVLATFQEKIIAVQQDGMLALSFHPELVPDDRMLRYFLTFCKK